MVENLTCLSDPLSLLASCTFAAVANTDYSFGSAIISHNDVDPWGVRLIGPYPDGITYLVSFNWGNAMVGPVSSLPSRDTTAWKAQATLSTKSSEWGCTGDRMNNLEGGQKTSYHMHQ